MSNMELLGLFNNKLYLLSEYNKSFEKYCDINSSSEDKKQAAINMRIVGKRFGDIQLMCTHPIGLQLKEYGICPCLICGKSLADNEITSSISVPKLNNEVKEYLTSELRSLLVLIPEIDPQAIANYIQKELNEKLGSSRK